MRKREPESFPETGELAFLKSDSPELAYAAVTPSRHIAGPAQAPVLVRLRPPLGRAANHALAVRGLFTHFSGQELVTL